MGFKDEVANDIATFLNREEFGEPVLYNGVEITAIPTIGINWEKGNLISTEGSSARATFSVSVTDVLVPEQGDQIEYAGVWTVVKTLYTKAGMHRIACTSSESVY